MSRGRGSCRPYTCAEVREVLQMRHFGYPHSVIAFVIARSERSVDGIVHRLRRSGHDVGGYRWAPVDAELTALVDRLRTDGVPIKVAGRLLGLTPPTVAHHARLARRGQVVEARP